MYNVFVSRNSEKSYITYYWGSSYNIDFICNLLYEDLYLFTYLINDV